MYKRGNNVQDQPTIQKIPEMITKRELDMAELETILEFACEKSKLCETCDHRAHEGDRYLCFFGYDCFLNHGYWYMAKENNESDRQQEVKG